MKSLMAAEFIKNNPNAVGFPQSQPEIKTPLAKTQPKRAHSRTDRIRQSNPSSGRSGLKRNF